MQASNWWNTIPYNDYMLQVWVLTTLLSLIIRFAFTIFSETYNRYSFRDALSLGFFLGLVFIHGGRSIIALFTGNVKFEVPTFFVLSLLLYSFFLTWDSLDIAGNTIIGSLFLSCIIVPISISSIQSTQFTEISSYIFGPGFYVWIFISLLISTFFLVYFWFKD